MLHLWADCSVGLGGALQILLLLLLTLTVTAEFVVRRLFTSSIDSTQCSSMIDGSIPQTSVTSESGHSSLDNGRFLVVLARWRHRIGRFMRAVL